MKSIFVVLRSFTKRKNNTIKIISLSIGLSLGLMLIAKTYFEKSYDSFFPDGERIYMVMSNISSDENSEYSQRISGGVITNIYEEIPEIEAATRFTGIAYNDIFVLTDKRKLQGTFILADATLFDIFPRKVLAGNVKDVLSQPMYVMISSELAESMGGVESAMGLSFQLESSPGNVMTIGGVFEKLPRNTHLKYDIIVSMSSAPQFISDNPLSWNSAKRYSGYVKLQKEAKPKSIIQSIEELHKSHIGDNQPASTTAIQYSLKPLQEIHSSDIIVEQNILLYSILAIIIILSSIMNYALITVSSLTNRSKEISVLKCYGAAKKDVYIKILSETFVDFTFAFLASILLISMFHNTVFNLLETSIADIFTLDSCLVLLFTIIIIFLLCGIIPGYSYANIPVHILFSLFSKKKRVWKLSMLFVQVMAANFFITFLFIINKQYDHIVKFDLGYNYDNVAYCNMAGVNADIRQKALDEVKRLPEVSMATTTADLLFDSPKKSYVMQPDDDISLFQVANIYSTGNGFCELMEIAIIEGRTFIEDANVTNEVLVSRSFADKIKTHAGWENDIIGKSIKFADTEATHTICGVYEDVHLGIIDETPLGASVMFHDNEVSHNMLIKFHHMTPEGIQKVTTLLGDIFPEKELAVNSFSSVLTGRYNSSLKFRNAVMISGLIALIICFIGLIGYTNNEISDKQKEIAIRKVNGATTLRILSYFIKSIIRTIILPGLCFGGIIAFIISNKWLEKFSEKIDFDFFIYVICALVVLFILLSTIALNSYRAASENPANVLKGNK